MDPPGLVTVSLDRLAGTGDETGIRVAVHLDGEPYLEEDFPHIPPDVLTGYQHFLSWRPAGTSRDQLAADRRIREQHLDELGHALRGLCFPGDSARALADLIRGAKVGSLVEVRFESAVPELLGLPFETLRLENGELLVMDPKVIVVRRPAGIESVAPPKLAGPLKVLVAVGAPDEDKTKSDVLDLERQLQTILDAVEAAKSREDMQVRILEVGSPGQIGEAFEGDAYHVLHLSCHGKPGELELETEDGDPVPVSAAQLLAPIREHGRPLPMIFLNTCHSAVQAGDTASLAEELLRAGVPVVLAMQTSVTDHYASRLARRFYEHMARSDKPRAARALALARRELEVERRKALGDGQADARSVQPEVATATLYRSGDELILVSDSANKDPLKRDPCTKLPARCRSFV